MDQEPSDWQPAIGDGQKRIRESLSKNQLTYQVNDVLTKLFDAGGLMLVDFKLEFGVFYDRIVLGDEFSPDGCRVWDKETKKKLDKDRFRQSLGDVIEGYEEVAHRIGVPLTA